MVISGNKVQEIFKLAKANKFAIPAVNVIGSNSINATLETASKLNSPVIIQFSNGGAIFNAGKSLKNTNQNAAVKGAISGAKHVHEISELYGATVILHTDHASRKLLPWIDGLILESEKNYKISGKPLFSSHMIDLSEEKIEENIFRGQSRNLVGKRVFGGQVLGQALRAASYTTDRPAHSLHAYFLFGGDVNAPIIYEVDRIRDGRSFVSRQVRAIQHGKTIFMCMVSFADNEDGLNYQIGEPEYPAPESLKSEAELKKMMVEF